MADKVQIPVNGVSKASPGTFYSEAFATNSERDFSTMCLLPTSTGAGTDTITITVEESDQREFTDPERIRTCLLTKPAGTTQGAFDVITGGLTSPNILLQQKFNLADVNYNRFLRIKYVIANTATAFTDITILLLSNARI